MRRYGLVCVCALVALLSGCERAGAPLSSVVKLSVGRYHSCALQVDGTTRCWGGNFSGQLGDGSRETHGIAVRVADAPKAIDLFVGGDTSCLRSTDDQAHSGLTAAAPPPVGAHAFYCWGNNLFGQVGDGGGQDRTRPRRVTLSGEMPLASVQPGGGHTCALTGDGQVYCWGQWPGLGSADAVSRLDPVRVDGVTDVAALAVADLYVCALSRTGTVTCWGLGGPVPRQVADLSGVTALAAGASHTCALMGDKTVRCWGYNDEGRLGDGTTESRSTPVPVVGLESVVQLSAGSAHTCALLEDRTVRCWGANADGQLGDGTYRPRTSPVPVVDLSGVVEIGASSWGHSCALLESGEVKCWGGNDRGQLGNASRVNSNRPVTVHLPG